MIVLDASAAAAVLLNRDASAPRIRERMERAEDGLHVPHLFEIEAVHVLRRYAFGDVLSPQRARPAPKRLFAMRLTRYPHTALLSRAWESRENATAYEAAYIALS